MSSVVDTGSLRWVAKARQSALVPLLSGTFVAQLVAILASPLLTRIYGPVAFGSLTVFVSCASIVGAVATLRCESAVVLPLDEPTARALWRLGLRSAFLFSVVVTLGLIPAGAWLAVRLGVPGLGGSFWLLGIAVFGISWYALDSGLMLRAKSYERLSARTMVQAIGQVVGQLAMAPALAGAAGLTVGFSMGRLLAQAVPRGLPVRPAVRISAAWASYRKFLTLSSVAALANTCGQFVPAILVSVWFGSAVAGWFGLTVRIVSLPVAVLGVAAGQAFIAHGSEAVRNDKADLIEHVHATTRRMATWGALPLAAACLTAPWTFPILFGREWVESGVYAAILLPGTAAQLIVSPVSSTLPLLERPADQLVWDLSRLALTVMSFLVVAVSTGSARLSIAALSFAMLISYAALWLRCRQLARESARG